MTNKQITGAILVFSCLLLWIVDIGLFASGVGTFSGLLTAYMGRKVGDEKLSRKHAFRVALVSGLLSALAIHWLKF